MFDSNKPQQTAEPASATAFLGKGAKLVGKISLDGPARIEGHIEGEIEAKETLTIGEDAVVKAKITGTTVIVHGQVTGDINARQRLELKAPGRVHGNITTATLVISEGTSFEGHCAMSEDSRAKLKVAPASISDAKPESASSTAR